MTTDIGIAAYLCFNGYTLLGVVTNKDYDVRTNPRKSFVLSHPDESKHEYMSEDILMHIDDWNSDRGGHRKFYMKMHHCSRELKNSVSMAQLEKL